LPGLALIDINDMDPLRDPAQVQSALDQAILILLALAMVLDLLRGGLADVNIGAAFAMPRGDLLSGR
jgi:hypothetical protein